MEVDSPHLMNGSINRNHVDDINLFPVPKHVGGEGLPYAPINWPNPGDIWSWRTGKRIAASGHHLDRYLYPPKRFQTKRHGKYGFASKTAVEQFVLSEFPNTDVKTFFDSFRWRIPSARSTASKDSPDGPPFWEAIGSSLSDSQDGDPVCKAGNKACSSLVVDNSSPEVMSCDICCNEPGFCRDCCCILCCQTISSAHGGYSYFRCEALVKNTICGHVAHINCGLRAYLAGTVGGSIGLDVEYYCRRCDARSDLFPHVLKLVQTCKSIASREQIEEILGVGVCILRGSKRTSAEHLLNKISLAMSKLKKGVDLKKVWKRKRKMKSSPTDAAGGKHCTGNGDLKLTDYKDASEFKALLPLIFSSSCDHRGESMALGDEIEQTLLELKNSQESEYKVAAETLIAQKKYIQSLHKRLDHEKSHLSKHASLANAETLLKTVLGQMEQVKGEVAKFNDMKEVSKGFGRTPKRILKEHFGIETED